uniref:Uncharacterized protein n=1 Tax=Streptomyces sp. NBC_00180 TaxID=2903632 RepID=A0AAU1I9I2_9ACTN
MSDQGDGQDEEQAKRWWRRIPWIAICTVLTALIGIASLAFTGVATFYGAEVAKDQLDQSREQADEETRWQASRVTYWIDAASRTPSVHIMNRSPDPVSQVSMAFFVRLPDGEQNLLFPVAVGELPPCSELVISMSALRYSKGTAWNKESWYFPVAGRTTSLVADQSVPHGAWFDGVPRFDFVDREGVDWNRSDGDLELGGYGFNSGPLWGDTAAKAWVGQAMGTERLKTAFCGDEAT